MNLTALYINVDREQYATGRITLQEFERRVDVTLQIAYEQTTWRDQHELPPGPDRIVTR